MEEVAGPPEDLLTLLEEGRYTLDDSIAAWVPEYRNPKLEVTGGEPVAAKRAIRVKDLFTHGAGIFDPFSRAESMNFPTLAEYVKALSEKPLRYEPGTAWLYGSSHHVLGYLVQQVSGVPLGKYVQEKILTPLGMRDTSYWPEDGKRLMFQMISVIMPPSHFYCCSIIGSR